MNQHTRRLRGELALLYLFTCGQFAGQTSVPTPLAPGAGGPPPLPAYGSGDFGRSNSVGSPAGDVPIPQGHALACTFNAGFAATLRGVYADGKTLGAVRTGNQGQTIYFRNPGPGVGGAYAAVRASASDSNIVWEIVPDGAYSPFNLAITAGLTGAVTVVSPSSTPDGSNYGAFTAGTSTSGIQEAVNALTSGGAVMFKQGTFTLSAQVALPTGISWFFFGQGPGLTASNGTTGSIFKGSASINVHDLWTLNDNANNQNQTNPGTNKADNLTFFNLGFNGVAAGGAVSNAMLNLTQGTDQAHELMLMRVSVHCTGAAPTWSLIADNNQDSFWYQVETYDVACSWQTPGGSVKMTGGKQNAGMSIAGQSNIFSGTTFSSTLTVTANCQANSTTHLFACYWNAPASGPNVQNNAGSAHGLVIEGGTIFNAGSTTTFFKSAASSPYNLTCIGVEFRQAVDNTVCPILDTSLSTHNVYAFSGNQFVSATGGISINLTKSNIGLGQPNVLVTSPSISHAAITAGVTDLTFTTPTLNTNQIYATSLLVEIEGWINISAFTATSIQFAVTFKDSGGTTHTNVVLPVASEAGGYGSTVSGTGSFFFHGRFRIQAGATAFTFQSIIVPGAGSVSYTGSAWLKQVG